MKYLLILSSFTACTSPQRLTPPAPTRALTPIAELDVRDIVRDIFVTRSSLPPTFAVQIADALVDEAQDYGVDPLLILAMIEVESQWNHDARSQSGAHGYMQLMPKTRAWMLKRETDLGNIMGSEQDVRIAVRYFALLSTTFPRTERALQAYNCGPGCVIQARRGNVELPKETQAYPRRVLVLRDRYQKLVTETLPKSLAAN